MANISDDLRRFHSKVIVDDVTGCAIWIAGRATGGYGRFHHNGRTHNAHRWLYHHTVGEIPDDLVVDHLCRNRTCVEPSHMRVVTNAENTLAAGSLSFCRANMDKTHCRRGHEFSDENTATTPRGHRACRECRRIDARHFMRLLRDRRKAEQYEQAAAV